MWLDVVGLLILAVFMVLGLLRGTLASLMRIVALIAAYLAAVWAAPNLGPAVSERFGMPPYLGIPLAGAVAFVLGYSAMGIASLLLRRWERRRRRGEERSPADRIGGAALGAVQGGVIVLLLGWLGLWIDAGRAAGTLTAVPDTSSSALARASGRIIETGAALMVDTDEPGARVAVSLAARPRETVTGLKNILANPRVEALQSDRLFWSYVEHGAVDAALNRGSFLGIAYDDTLRAEMATVGLVPEHAAEDARLFRNAVRDVLLDLSPRLRGLRDDPQVAALLEDPEIVAAIESGSTGELLANPSFRAVVHQVLTRDPEVATH